MLNHRKRYARKYLYMEDAFDEVGIDALESDDDNTMVPVNAGQDIGPGDHPDAVDRHSARLLQPCPQ